MIKKCLTMTRTTLIITMLLFTFTLACKQKETVPEKAKATFDKKYPAATAIKWENKDKSWQVDFTMNGKDYSADFTKAGNWTETKCYINSNELPDVIKNYLIKNYFGYEYDDIEYVEKPDGRSYELEVKKDGDKLDLQLSPDGKLIKLDI